MKTKTLLLVLRLVFGAAFIWSGVAKIKQPIAFTDAVRNFEMVGDPLAPALALFIPCVEITAGLCTLLGLAWKGGVVTLLLSLIVFSGALGIAWARGLDITCGCFGGSGAVNYPLALGRNLLLIVVGVALLVYGRNAFLASPFRSRWKNLT